MTSQTKRYWEHLCSLPFNRLLDELEEWAAAISIRSRFMSDAEEKADETLKEWRKRRWIVRFEVSRRLGLHKTAGEDDERVQ